MSKITEALKLAELVEASVEECMADDGMVAVIPLDLYNELIEALAAIREALVDHNPDATKMIVEPVKGPVELTDDEFLAKVGYRHRYAGSF